MSAALAPTIATAAAAAIRAVQIKDLNFILGLLNWVTAP
jgi:hypothetical protein